MIKEAEQGEDDATVTKRAIKLLLKKYPQLTDQAFITAVGVLEDKGKAAMILQLKGNKRHLWLKASVGIDID